VKEDQLPASVSSRCGLRGRYILTSWTDRESVLANFLGFDSKEPQQLPDITFIAEDTSNLIKIGQF